MLDKFLGTIFITISLLIGVAVSYVGYYLYSKQVESSNFLPVEAVVIKSYISKRHLSKGTPTYHKEVSFDYTVDGQKYNSNLWSFFGNEAERNERNSDHVLSHPIGKRFKAFYDPKNPKLAVIDNTAPKNYLAYAIAIFLVGFIGFIIFCAQQMFFSINLIDIDKARKIRSIVSRSVVR
jgi:hypothetical protein